MRTKLIFCGDEHSETIELEAYVNFRGSLFIEIKDLQDLHPFSIRHITLDKQTAIKLVKVLKSEISKMES